MYELPADFKEQSLVGYTLEMVCIGPYFVRLEFSKPAFPSAKPFHIGTKGNVILNFGTQELLAAAGDPSSMTPIVQLLMLDVGQVRRKGISSLELDFGLGRTIVILGENCPDFEVYSIQMFGEDEIFV